MSISLASSLAGKTIVITRPTHQAQALTRQLQQAGATVIACPLISIEALPCPLLSRIDALSTYQLALFTSPNAVECCVAQLPSLQPLHHMRIGVIGKATAQALAHYDLAVDYIPSTHFTSEELLALPEFQALAAQKVLLVKGKGGRTLLAETLIARGMEVTLCEVYQRIPLALPTTPIEWEAAHWVMITSLEALEHLISCWQGTINPAHVNLLVGSTRIAQAAQLLGFKQIRTAQNPSDTAMWNALQV